MPTLRFSVATLVAILALVVGADLHAQTEPKPDRVTLDELKKQLEEQKKKRAEQPPAPRPKTTSRPAGQTGGFDPGDRAAYSAHLREELARIPEDIRKTPVKTADLHQMVDRCMGLLDDYLARFKNAPDRAEFLRHKARLITMNQSRHVYARSSEIRAKTKKNLNPDEMRVIRREYLTGALDCVVEAESLTDDPELMLKLEKIRGQVYYFGDYLQEAIDQYQKIVREYPQDPKAAESQTALIGAYEKAKQFEGGVKACDDFFTKHLRSEFASHVINYKGKMLLYLGRAEAAIEHLEKYREFMQNAHQGKPIEQLGGYTYSEDVRRSFGTYLDRIDFQIGFAHYALGQIAQAKNAFQACLDRLQAQSTNGKLDQVGQVFMGRATRLLSTIDTVHGKPAPRFDLGDAWVNSRFDLSQEQGNVVCLFFNPYENKRSEEFALAIQAFYEQRWNDGFRAAWIALPKGTKNWDQQLQRLDANRKSLGVSYPTGLAQTAVWPPQVYTSYNIAPGTPTLVLVDRAGNIAWYKMDPTFRDFEIAGRVAERLLRKAQP